jgi:hydroxyethylthiazole kinase-like uncharacterized protein yjeF
LKKINWQEPLTLLDVAQTRHLESLGMARVNSGPSLMAQAGLAVAKLALAIKPFAPCYWIFCGPGNNGGDGLEAAKHLHLWGRQVRVVLWQPEMKRPTDAANALMGVNALGIAVQAMLPSKLDSQDLCIDAMLGVGLRSSSSTSSTSLISPSEALMQTWIDGLYQLGADVLAVDVPSGLNANTGQFQNKSGGVHIQDKHIQAKHTLQLLTAKPGCFTAHGRDACGTQWLETLGCEDLQVSLQATALLNSPPRSHSKPMHASHKGTFGDVAIIGGESVDMRGMGMTGAVDLAASAALHAGAGRVMACYLSSDASSSSQKPRLAEIMHRHFSALNLKIGAIVCGCGGGEAVRQVLPKVLQESMCLVLDADALNAIAKDPWLRDLLRLRAAKKWSTVITPHPLEAARLINTSSTDVQNDRLHAAQTLAENLKCTVVLKGSGTVIAKAGTTPVINPTGNARLATGGTGDVLAGVMGARMAQGLGEFEAACAAVFEHGEVADEWPLLTLTAGKLAELIRGPQTASW